MIVIPIKNKTESGVINAGNAKKIETTKVTKLEANKELKSLDFPVKLIEEK